MWWGYGMIVGLLGWLALAVQAAEYQVVDLGQYTWAGAVNAAGTTVGSVEVLNATGQREQTAAIVAPQVTILGPGRANGIAGHEVVGYASFGDFGLHTHAFAWNARHGIRDLGTLGSADLFSAATGVNQTLTITGYADAGNSPLHPPPTRPVAWVATQILDLGTLGGAAGYADAINAYGDIVGQSDTAAGQTHATLWPVEGGVVDLDTLGSSYSYALSINASRVIVGHALTDGRWRGFRWTLATGMETLNVLPGHVTGGANAVTDAGVIVGSSTPTAPSCCPQSHAVRWVGGVIMDLNMLIDAPGWVLEQALAINASGVIVGTGSFNGQPHGFLLQPIVPVVATPPLALVVEVHGDFNGDGYDDLAGLADDTTIWLCIAGAACEQLPGRAFALVAGDLDGDGHDDLAALGTDMTIWVMTDGMHWQQLPGRLSSLVIGDLLADGRMHLAGLAYDTTIWLSPQLGQWQQLPGRLKTLVAGDLLGHRRDGLAGLGGDTTIWAMPDMQPMTQLPGRLVTLRLEEQASGPSTMIGMAADGVMWRERTLGNWERVASDLGP